MNKLMTCSVKSLEKSEQGHGKAYVYHSLKIAVLLFNPL